MAQWPDITAAIREAAPGLRGRLEANAPLAPITWFRVGGPAQALFLPADEDDLAAGLKATPPEMPVTVVGLGSNLLVRDGGIEGVVIRPGRGFTTIAVEDGYRIRCGVAVPDRQLAKAAADAGVAGLSFYNGIPGSIGGALCMNAGDKRPQGESQIDADGRVRTDTSEHLIEARAIDRSGRLRVLSKDDMGFGYRHSTPTDLVFTEALFQGTEGDPDTLRAEMAAVERYRETHQPTRERTGGSTFKNPPGMSAWKLIDAAGCRGFRVGTAKMSEKHCNFLIADEDATAFDIEMLGETVRRRVYESSGVLLEWEIKRLGAFGETGVVEPFTPRV